MKVYGLACVVYYINNNISIMGHTKVACHNDPHNRNIRSLRQFKYLAFEPLIVVQL